MSDNIPTPLASGATDHGGPNGIPPSSQSPASDAAMIAQDVANKYPNQAPAVLTSGTPQMPTLAPQGPAGMLRTPRLPRLHPQLPRLRMRCIKVCTSGHFQFLRHLPVT